MLLTSRADVVAVDHRSHNRLTICASFLPGNHTQTFDLSTISRIIIALGGGNDVAVVDDDVHVPVLLDGGADNDILQAGGGDAVLVGGDGSDIRIGGKKRDILIGGLGSDILLGRGGQDIIIGGRTDYDATPNALFAALSEWARTDLALAHRMAHLRTGGGLNGLTVFTSSTVHDDNAVDILTGGSGSDWYWANVSQDIFVGKKKEVVN